MELSRQELVDLAEAVGTRVVYLVKMIDPEMGIRADLVQEAVQEVTRMNELQHKLRSLLAKC